MSLAKRRVAQRFDFGGRHMTKLTTAIAACAALTLATGALAEAHEEGGEAMSPHFEYEGALSDMAIVGGVGGEVFGASWTETLNINVGGNMITVTSKCMGMDQPEGSMFDRHFTCTQSAGESSGAVIFGCNVENEEGNEMSCYGYFEGKTGNVEGNNAMHTAYYWFMPDGSGKVVGSGQWMM